MFISVYIYTYAYIYIYIASIASSPDMLTALNSSGVARNAATSVAGVVLNFRICRKMRYIKCRVPQNQAMDPCLTLFKSLAPFVFLDTYLLLTFSVS